MDIDHSQERTYPYFSACGLNCGLCPRHYTEGPSKCPGCAGAGFSGKHPSCGVLNCCRRRGIEYCFLCEAYPCEKYEGADASDSFISHQNQLRDNERARREGLPAYRAELDEKREILRRLLMDFDDGRRKSFFCVAVNLLPLTDLRAALAAIEGEGGTPKERAGAAARALQTAADARGICLKLRKKTKGT